MKFQVVYNMGENIVLNLKCNQVTYLIPLYTLTLNIIKLKNEIYHL